MASVIAEYWRYAGITGESLVSQRLGRTHQTTFGFIMLRYRT